MKKLLVSATVLMGLLFVSQKSMAQDSIQVDFQVDIVNKHIWRGQDYGNFSIQPQAEARWKGVYLRAAASTGLEEADYERLDVSLGYRAPFGLNVGVGSLYRTGFDKQKRYFFFKEKETGHRFEANLGYENRWFSIQAYTIFGGNDFKLDGKRAYSTYVELSAPFRLASCDWLARVGLSPMESSGYKTDISEDYLIYDSMNDYLYGDGFCCTTASLRATKCFKVGKFSLPVFVELNGNPYTQRMYGIAGISLKPF